MPTALRPLVAPLLFLVGWGAVGCAVGCAGESAEEAAAKLPPLGPEPAWPTVLAEPPAPAGYAWQTVGHKMIRARLLVPDGATVTESDETAEAPFLRVAAHGITAEITFNAGSAWIVPVLANVPVKVGGVVVDHLVKTADNVAWQTEAAGGGARVTAYTRGSQCVIDLGPFQRDFATIEAAFTVCGSLRPPPIGAWGPAVSTPSGTAIPGGAWVEPSRAEMVGDSLLGPYAPRVYTGWFGLTHTNCPADYAALGTVAEGEGEVAVARHDSPSGPAYVRRARSTREGVPFDSGTRIVAPRGDGCCVAEIFPFLAAPSDAEIDYVVALCDTTGRM